MKKLKFLVLALATVVFLSCSSSSDGGGGSSDSTFIKFKINGTASNMSEPSTVTSLNAAIFGSQDVGSDIRTLILRTPSTALAGTHDIVNVAPSVLDAYGVSYSFGDISFDATSGTMTITSIGEEYMTGTFSCSAVYEGVTYNITEGSFRVFKPVPVD